MPLAIDLGQARFSEACLVCVLHPLMQYSDERGATPVDRLFGDPV
jgi:hypothetical protein